MTGSIYFFQSEKTPDGPVKIGYTSRRLRRRQTELQVSNHETLILLVDVTGTLEDETSLHRIFKEYQIRGEWFQYAPTIQDLVFHLVEGGGLQSWLESQ